MPELYFLTGKGGMGRSGQPVDRYTGAIGTSRIRAAAGFQGIHARSTLRNENDEFAKSSDELAEGISIVIPVYNSENTLRELPPRISQALGDKPHELILVDDGSRDRSWDAIEALIADHAFVRGIRLSRNYGQHNALLCGIRSARYATLVTMDDDLQHPPEEISKLLQEMGNGYDVVYGRPEREQHGILRNFASKATKLALSATMGAVTASHVSAFRAFRTATRDAFADYTGPFVCIDVLLCFGTNKFSSVPVRSDPRTVGESNYTLRMLIRHAVNMWTGFSIVPLQVASILGLAFTFVGLLMLIYVLGRFLLQGDTVPGFPFLASAIAIFSGAQMFAIGIIGEYLARVHVNVMKKPQYVVRGSSAGS